jgi:thiol-disulfide isomerase/thioredoxin
MKFAGIVFLLVSVLSPSLAQDHVDGPGPANEKAMKSYHEGLEFLGKHQTEPALEALKRADKQDGGHCIACQKMIIKYALELQDWKAAETAAEEAIAEAQGNKDVALAHYDLGMVLMDQGLIKKKDDSFARAHQEMAKALESVPNFPQALYIDGRALALLKQDDAAKVQFERFVQLAKPEDPKRQRAQRYISEPELARARMAPAFAVTTLDGKHMSLDDLQGKVVLIDFWATWCEPCREALPHLRDTAKKFEGQPLVILSVSLDSDDKKWKEYIANNGMTWLHYRDGGFTGTVSKLYGVTAIPHTFTIDTDGVLQDEHIGDASLDGKLKKLLARAQELQVSHQPAQ